MGVIALLEIQAARDRTAGDLEGAQFWLAWAALLLGLAEQVA